MVVKASTFDVRGHWNRSLGGQLGLMILTRLSVNVTAAARYFTGSLTYVLVPSVQSFHKGSIKQKKTLETAGTLQPRMHRYSGLHIRCPPSPNAIACKAGMD